jgi:hypothetical protein
MVAGIDSISSASEQMSKMLKSYKAKAQMSSKQTQQQKLSNFL